MVVPVNKIVKIQVTAADVLHSWAMPSFGFKIDAIPGRLNQFWFKAEREGTYHGQCSELCGARHAYMPITVQVVSDEAYAAWLAEGKTKFRPPRRRFEVRRSQVAAFSGAARRLRLDRPLIGPVHSQIERFRET